MKIPFLDLLGLPQRLHGPVLWGGAAVVLGGILWAAVATMNHATDTAVTVAQESGRTQQRAEQAESTIEQVEKANEASDDLRRDDVVRDAECLRNARNPANC